MEILYIIIPAYNKETNIEQCINNWYPVVEKQYEKHNTNHFHSGIQPYNPGQNTPIDRRCIIDAVVNYAICFLLGFALKLYFRLTNIKHGERKQVECKREETYN